MFIVSLCPAIFAALLTAERMRAPDPKPTVTSARRPCRPDNVGWLSCRPDYLGMASRHPRFAYTHVRICVFMYMAYCFVPILFLLPFILSLFCVYSTFIYFTIPVTVGRHAQSPGHACQVGGSAAYTFPQASSRAEADRRQQSCKNAGASSCRPMETNVVCSVAKFALAVERYIVQIRCVAKRIDGVIQKMVKSGRLNYPKNHKIWVIGKSGRLRFAGD